MLSEISVFFYRFLCGKVVFFFSGRRVFFEKLFILVNFACYIVFCFFFGVWS